MAQDAADFSPYPGMSVETLRVSDQYGSSVARLRVRNDTDGLVDALIECTFLDADGQAVDKGAASISGLPPGQAGIAEAFATGGGYQEAGCRIWHIESRN